MARARTLTLAKCGGVDLMASIDACRGDDMVQQFMIDDELDEQTRHKVLIECRMNANQQLLRQVGAKTNGTLPRATTPSAPANIDRGAVRKKSCAHILENRIQVMMTSAVR